MKSINLVLFIISTCFCRAQISFPDSAAVWINETYCYESGSWIGELCQVHKFCAPGEDTLIGSNIYSKVNDCNNGYEGCLREEDSTVYYIPKDSLNPFILYKYNVNSGDTIFNVIYKLGSYQTGYAIVDDVYTDFIGGQNRLVVAVGGQGMWVEGIGNLGGFLAEYWPNVSGWQTNLHCMSIADTTYYPDISYEPCDLNYGFDIGIEDNYSKAITIYPNPADEFLQTNLDLFDYKIYDNCGRKVQFEQNVSCPISVLDLDPGTYIIHILTAEGDVSVLQFVKQ